MRSMGAMGSPAFTSWATHPPTAMALFGGVLDATVYDVNGKASWGVS